MKKFFTSVVLFATAMFAANAQQLQTGDTFEYTNADGVTKKYTVVGENLIENPNFDNGAEGWDGGDGNPISGYKLETSGGADGGSFLVPGNDGKGGNRSIGTAWEMEKGKQYVFSFFMRNMTNTEAEAVAGSGYIKASMSDTPREETAVLQPLPHLDANLAWTQNTWVVTADYSYLSLCARWLGSSKGFDAFILAEVEEAADTKELEDLLATCEEWIEHFEEEDAKGYEDIKALTDQAYALIDSEEFTAADLNAMVHTLKEALLDFRMANADDENTVDVTARYIKNTKFDNSWTGWDVVNAAVGNGMNIRNFSYFEDGLNPVAEINGAPSVESSISQTVHGLPLGYYRFTVQCVMNHSADLSDPESTTGAVIFCNGSELDMKTQQMTPDGSSRENSYPETFTIEGVVSGDSMVVGFKGLAGANFTYVAIDNVSLEFAGFDAGIYIDGLIESINEWIVNNSDYLLPGIAFALEEECFEAEDAMDGTDEEMNAAYIKLDAAFAKAKESVKLMEQLNNDYEEFVAFVGETNFDGADAAIEVIDEVAAFIELEDEEASYEELYAMIDKLQQAENNYRLSQKATKEEPADYSFFIPNANFEAKGNWVWTVTQSGGGTDLWVGNCRPSEEGGENRQGVNLWGNHLTGLDLHQELTGLPNGLYGISAELITQAGYATDQHLYVSGINKAVSANLDVEGWDSYQWTTLQTGYVVVIDGTLTIGAEASIFGEASEGWFQATNFKLQYYGEASNEDLQVAYESTLAEAQALVATLLKGDAVVLQAKIDEAVALSATSFGEAAALLVEPIATAKAAAKVYDAYKNGAYQAAIDNGVAFTYTEAMDIAAAAVAFADAITAADTTTSAALAAIEAKLNAYNEYTVYLEEVGYMVNDRKAGYAQANIDDVKATVAAQKADLVAKFQVAENVADLKSKLEFVVTFLVKSAYMNAQAGTDVTALIVNPTFDSNAAGWLVNKGMGNTETNASQHWGADSGNRYMDSYNGSKGALNFRASQVLTDIPNGTYTVKVATRSDSIGAFVFALGEAITSEEVNDSTVMLQVANSAATKWTEIVASADSMGGIWQAENEKWAAAQAYDEAIYNANNGKGFGWTWATIDDVVVTNHEMVLGVTTDSTVSKVVFQGKWFSVDDWSLTLKEAGDNSNWTIESGIENVAAIVKETAYFAIDGRRLAIPAKGVNIIKTVYSDGRIEVKKVFVK